MLSIRFRDLFLLGCFLLSSCAGRTEKTMDLVQQSGWKWFRSDDPTLPVSYAMASVAQSRELWIYLEGDGRAYLSPSQPASDPTPSDPIALRMALSDPDAERSVYLARPCQYEPDIRKVCSQDDWTLGRYSPRIIDSMNRAISHIKRERQAEHLVLVGYSGGAALAVLLASQRSDVKGIITVAGNLDTEVWARANKLTPLANSRNPADVAPRLYNMLQFHFSGGRDAVIPLVVAKSYQEKSGPSPRAKYITISDYDHECCWVETWPSLLQKIELFH